MPIHKKVSKKTKHELGIRSIINSRYHVFDRSGKLPFSIVFGLVRQSREDTDPRSIIIQTSNSVLDVPYALSHGMLQLRVFREKTGEDVLVETERLGLPCGNKGESSVTLPSPVEREGNWRTGMVIYRYPIDPESDLASLFKVGEKYTIRIVKGSDFGGLYDYADPTETPTEQSAPPKPGSKPKLINSKAEGRATFAVVPALPCPPKIQTQMRWRRTLLEVKVTNLDSEAVTVQTSGRQHFCVPRGPLKEEAGHMIDDGRPRLIDAGSPSPELTLRVVDLATRTVVRGTRDVGPCRPPSQSDPRPTLKELVTLKPDEPLVRQVDVKRILSELPDGRYGLQMEPRGVWWCLGSCGDFTLVEDNDRVPQELYRSMIPPVVLECEGIIEVQVENGMVKEESVG